MSVRLSVIIPAHNASMHLARALQALRQSHHEPHEVIVVDDGSTDTTRAIAQDFGSTILTTLERRGPAFARNMAAKCATGDVLLFLDADVCVHSDTLSRIMANFSDDSKLDALIGSYDYAPASPDFLSQYRNLMHAYVHQNGSPQASTFWSGCGAIRRSAFLDHGGFNETYGRPAVEDIEFGYRLRRNGCKIFLDHAILVTHLKRWRFWGLIKTDIFDRGIPWTELILRERRMPDDLNLQLGQRLSVALTFLLVLFAGTRWMLAGKISPDPRLALITGISCLAVVMLLALNSRFYIFLATRRGIGFMSAAIPFHLLYHFYCGLSFLAGAGRYYARKFSLLPAHESATVESNHSATTGQESVL